MEQRMAYGTTTTAILRSKTILLGAVLFGVVCCMHFAVYNTAGPSTINTAGPAMINAGTIEIPAVMSERVKVTTTTTASPTASITRRGEARLLAAADVRSAAEENPGPYLGMGFIPEYFSNLSLQDAQSMFHSKITEKTYICRDIQRYGRPGDGGYNMCADIASNPDRKGTCLVYSFGIANEWSFDEEINERLGCVVHSFDPSMRAGDHMHKENIHFHKLGVWGKPWKKGGWQMKDIKSIMEMLNHTHTNIEYVKVDVEGAEWSIIDSIVQTGVHAQIKQLGFELHTPRRRAGNVTMSVHDYGEIFNGFDALARVGFQIYHAVIEPYRCCVGFEVLTPAEIAGTKQDLCCYEIFMINRNFLS